MLPNELIKNDTPSAENLKAHVEFQQNKILAMHELYDYDLLKFCMQSFKYLHSNDYFNELFAQNIN